jgi:hypothetical protein
MKKGQRVTFNGRKGTVVGSMPNGMIDVQFDDSSAVERKSIGRLARTNSSRRRRNPKEMVGIRSQERIPQLGLLTRADPPRLTADNTQYCGNPIDGTAYYVILPQKARSVSQFLTESLVRKAGVDPQGKTGEQVATEVKLYLEYTYGTKVSYYRTETSKVERPSQLIRMKQKQKKRMARIERDPSVYSKGSATRTKSAPSDAYIEQVKGESFYYMFKYTAKPSAALREYNLYAYRKFVVRSSGRALADVVAQSGGIDERLAVQMIRCGMVTLQRTEIGEGGSLRRETLTITDPTSTEAEKGEVIQVWDKAKEASPFFSLVYTSYSPVLPSKYAPCFTDEEQTQIKILEAGMKAIKSYGSALQSVVYLFDKWQLGEEKVRADAPERALNKLLRGYAAVNRWWESLYESDDDEFIQLREDISNEAPKADLDVPSFLSNSLKNLRGIAVSPLGTENLYQDESKRDEITRELIKAAWFNGFAPPQSVLSKGQISTLKDIYGIGTTRAAKSPFGPDSEYALTSILFGQPKWRKKVSLNEDVDFRRAFYALIYAYYALTGAPLWEKNRPVDIQSQFRPASRQLSDLVADIQGGERGMSGTGQTVYVTYNPILFQLVRSTWKTNFSILEEVGIANDLDATGRFGANVKWLHQLELSRVPVQATLAKQFNEATRLGKKTMEKAKSRKYLPILLFWPLGATREQWLDAAQRFVSDPVGQIKRLKQSLTIRVGNLIRGKDLKQTEVTADWSKGTRTSPISRSSLTKASNRHEELQAMLRAIDKRIENLGG